MGFVETHRKKKKTSLIAQNPKLCREVWTRKFDEALASEHTKTDMTGDWWCFPSLPKSTS